MLLWQLRCCNDTNQTLGWKPVQGIKGRANRLICQLGLISDQAILSNDILIWLPVFLLENLLNSLPFIPFHFPILSCSFPTPNVSLKKCCLLTTYALWNASNPNSHPFLQKNFVSVQLLKAISGNLQLSVVTKLKFRVWLCVFRVTKLKSQCRI